LAGLACACSQFERQKVESCFFEPLLYHLAWAKARNYRPETWNRHLVRINFLAQRTSPVLDIEEMQQRFPLWAQHAPDFVKSKGHFHEAEMKKSPKGENKGG